MAELRVAIVGGGIGGLTLANCLERRGIAFEAVEIAEAFEPVGAGIGLGCNAMAVLRSLGLGDAVEARGALIRVGRISDFRGRVLTEANTAALAPRFGPSVALHRADLSDALVAGLASSAVRLGTTAARIDPGEDGVRVTFSDGREATFDVLVGADGIGSQVRETSVASRERLYSGYTCWRLCVRFDTDGLPSLNEMWGRGTRFGIVPIGGDRVYCFAVANAPRGRSEPESGRAERLRERFADYASPVGEILARTRDADVHHADLDELAAGPWLRGRVALLGDAAHALTPNMGQGAAMAIEDAWVLAEELAGVAGSSDVPAALARYEAARRPRVTGVQRRSRSLGRMAQLESRPLRAARNLVTRLVPPGLAERGLVSFLKGSPVILPGSSPAE